MIYSCYMSAIPSPDILIGSILDWFIMGDPIFMPYAKIPMKLGTLPPTIMVQWNMGCLQDEFPSN